MASSSQGLRKLQSWWHRDARTFASFPPGPYRTVLDVGAHAGSFSVRAHRYYQPARIIMVEADAELAEKLRQKFAHQSGCQVIAAAITEKTGEIEFHINESRGASSVLPIHQQTTQWFGRSLREVKVVKLP